MALVVRPVGALNSHSTSLRVASAHLVPGTRNTGSDVRTTAHMRNWMDCVLSRKQPNAPVEAGYSHSIATIMTNAAVRTGYKATFDEATQEVMADGKVFKF